MRTVPVRRAALAAAAWVVAASPGAARAQAARDSTRPPTIAVLDFETSAMRDPESYAALGKGMADLLITSLQQNPRVQVLERARLRAVLDEHDLGKLHALDPSTVARAGELLGAQYLVTGGVFVDRRERMRLTVRVVQVSSTRIVFGDDVNADADAGLEAVDAVAAKLGQGLRLPGSPAAPARRSSRAPGQGRGIAKLGQAIEAEDRKNRAAAAALYAQFVADASSASMPEQRRKAEERLRELQRQQQ